MFKKSILLTVLLFVSTSFAKAEKAPATLVTERYGCGNYECCVFDYEWEVKNDTDVLDKPGRGKKLEKLKAQQKVKFSTSTNLASRGVLKLTKDKAGGKAGKEYYFYSKDPSEGVILYEKTGAIVKSGNGEDYISMDMLKPECKSEECVGEVKTPSKGETFIRMKTKNGKDGWVNLSDVDPSC